MMSSLTPMMQHYVDTQRQYPGCLLFYRLGDFYELFFEDAVRVSQALHLTLTKRGKSGDQDIPMCGVPVSHYETYLHRLVQRGFRVAVCEQVEDVQDAKKRGGQSMVRREVVRVVTPGTLTEDALLSPTEPNHLVSLVRTPEMWVVAYTDISTGTFLWENVPHESLQGALFRINPKEILTDDSHLHSLQDWSDITIGVDTFPSTHPDHPFYDSLSVHHKKAVGWILSYLDHTQGHLPLQLKAPLPFEKKGLMDIDVATRRNLEIETSLTGDVQKSLWAVLHHTQTSPGARLLRERLNSPLTHPDGIDHRLNHVAFWVNHMEDRTWMRTQLKHIPDFQRILSRVASKRATPRDLQGLRDGYAVAQNIGETLQKNSLSPPPRELQQALQTLTWKSAVCVRLAKALADELPTALRDGGVIRNGFDHELDQKRHAHKNAHIHMANMQTQYIEETGLKLKIRHNNIVGYYIEVPLSQKNRVPSHFIHRQTLTNQQRYTTSELMAFEKHMTHASYEAHTRESHIIDQLLEEIHAESTALHRVSEALSLLDVASTLAHVAATHGYVRPRVDESLAFRIVGGRHPVVESFLPESQPFIGNDCDLSSGHHLGLMTGPNMGGKSTFLRQTALIVWMAQMGSFVPAKDAHIGVVDGLFSRVGASDDLAKGHSTFMVEMLETATILQKATPHSYVILDEIGRGTSTQEGCALAAAILEHLHNEISCRALFATHYHELTQLAPSLPSLRCYTMRVQEWQDKIVFLHQVIPGSATQSFGIHVAQMAGLPSAVIQRAETWLEHWKKDHPPMQNMVTWDSHASHVKCSNEG